MVKYDDDLQLSRAGSLQSQRGLKALATDSFAVEERSSHEWLVYLKQFARWLRFYGVDGEGDDWSGFFPEDTDFGALLDWVDGREPASPEIRQLAARPDLALFLTFLRLMRHPAEQFRQMTGRHLDYYYRQVLGMEVKPAEPDQAHLLLTLNDDAESQVLPAGCRFEAGTDKTGEPIYYQLINTTGVNHSRIDTVRTLSLFRSSDDHLGFLQTELLNNSQGLAFPETTAQTFGELQLSDPERQSWPGVGLLVSSPLLWLSEGERNIKVRLNFAVTGLPAENLARLSQSVNELFTVSVTTEAGWQRLDNPDLVNFSITAAGDSWLLDIQLKEQFPALTLPEQPLPQGLSSPCLQLNVVADPQDRRLQSYELLRTLELATLDLSVTVSGLSQLLLRNDGGVLEAGTAIEPFGSQPRTNSRLQFSHPELAIKPLSSLTVSLDWNDKPADMPTHYERYKAYLEDSNWPNHQVAFISPYGSSSSIELFEGDLTLDLSTESASFYPQGVRWTPLQQLPESSADPLEWPYWYGLQLTKDDFGHNLYGDVVAWQGNRTLEQVQKQSAEASRAVAQQVQESVNRVSGSVEEVSDTLEQMAAAMAEANAPDPLESMQQEVVDALEVATENVLSEQDLEDVQLFIKTVNGSTDEPQIREKAEGLVDDLDNGPDKDSEDDDEVAEYTELVSSVVAIVLAYSSQADGETDGDSGDESTDDSNTPADIPVTPIPEVQELELVSVKQPWTPLADQFRVSYTAQAQVTVSEAGLDAQHPVLHVHPVGYQAVADAEQLTLLPALGDAGYLYIGLSQTPARGIVSLLFQISPVDANPDLSDALVQWSYLANNRWVTFAADSQEGDDDRALILSDETNQLINSGIIRFALDESMTRDRGFPGDQQLWLRASLRQVGAGPVAWSRLQGVYAQAVTVSFDDSVTPPRHLPARLPASTISSAEEGSLPTEVYASIGGIEQPYVSFGGRPEEAEELFATRVSERLRHRGRALTLWDYERLTLERFPEIALAHCLRDPDKPYGIRLLVVPVVDDESILKPRVSRKIQHQIGEYLQPRMPVTGSLTVASPEFQEARFEISLAFNPEYDPGHILQELNAGLIALLNPWRSHAVEQGDGRDFRSGIPLSDVIAFVERQPYVLLVMQLEAELLVSEGDSQVWQPVTGPVVTPTRNDMILVPASQHTIRVLPEGSLVFEGISRMQIKKDFIVGAD